MTTYSLGAKPHKPDERDWRVPASLLQATVLDRKLWKMHGPDFRIDQGGEGTCVGHGGTNALLADPRPHYAFPEFATVEMAHQYARALYLEATGDTTYQNGAYVRQVLDVMVRRGLGNYYRCASADDAVAALDHGPIIFASPWYNSMWDAHGVQGGSFIKVDPSSGLAGYHCYLLTGKDLTGTEFEPWIRMENSWGPDWGTNGLARIRLNDLHILYDGDAYLFTEVKF